jgi:hypothetical protein
MPRRRRRRRRRGLHRAAVARTEGSNGSESVSEPSVTTETTASETAD